MLRQEPLNGSRRQWSRQSTERSLNSLLSLGDAATRIVLADSGVLRKGAAPVSINVYVANTRVRFGPHHRQHSTEQVTDNHGHAKVHLAGDCLDVTEGLIPGPGSASRVTVAAYIERDCPHVRTEEWTDDRPIDQGAPQSMQKHSGVSGSTEVAYG